MSDAFFRRAIATLGRVDPSFALNAGELDAIGRLPSGRTGAVLERLEALGALASEAKALMSASDDPALRLDCELLQAAHALESFAELELGVRAANPDVLSPLGDWLITALFAPFAREEERFSRIADMVDAVPIYVAEAVTTLGRPDPLWLDIAASVAQEFPTLFDALCAAARGRAAAATAERLQKAALRAVQACKDFARALAAAKPGAVVHVLGKERFAELLRRKHIPLDARDLRELGTEQLEKAKEKRALALRALLGFDDVRAGLRRLDLDRPATLGQAIDEVRDVCRRARDFVGERALCPIPSDEALSVIETPAFARPLIPFAAIIVPKPLWPEQRSVYYVSVASARADLRNTAVHEAYPGHHLQFAVAHHQGSLARNLVWTSSTLGAMGVDTCEGWAHYCEALMHGQGFADTLEDRVQVLNDSVWRAARVLIDIGLSTGELSREQAAQQLCDEVGMSKDAAWSEVRRYCLMPGYNLCYAYGKYAIRALRKEAERAWGNGFSPSRFHALVMSNGNAPLTWAEKRLRVS